MSCLHHSSQAWGKCSYLACQRSSSLLAKGQGQGSNPDPGCGCSGVYDYGSSSGSGSLMCPMKAPVKASREEASVDVRIEEPVCGLGCCLCGLGLSVLFVRINLRHDLSVKKKTTLKQNPTNFCPPCSGSCLCLCCQRQALWAWDLGGGISDHLPGGF